MTGGQYPSSLPGPSGVPGSEGAASSEGVSGSLGAAGAAGGAKKSPPPTDSAGIPWGGRTVPDPGFAGDTGQADAGLLAALIDGSDGDLMAALPAARLLVPVAAVAGETSESEGTGLLSDKAADMAVVLLQHPDGRTALPVFTSVEALAAFDPSVRPVPVLADRVAQSAITERADLIVLDCASDTARELRASMVWALAQGRPWIPAHADPFVEQSVERVVADREEVLEVDLVDGAAPGQLTVRLTLVPGLEASGVQAIVTAIAEQLATDGEFRARVDGLAFTVV